MANVAHTRAGLAGPPAVDAVADASTCPGSAALPRSPGARKLKS